MDPLTHALLGAAVGHVAAGRRLGRMAACVGALAALAPDADVFIRSAADPLLAIEYHRGFTHSLLFAPAGAAAVAACIWLASFRRAPLVLLWAVAWLAYMSHCLLDSATTYGTQLFWPITSLRVGWDWISIIDPAFTLLLALGLGVALVRRRRAPAVAALALAGAYVAVGALQHRRSLNAVAALAAARGHELSRLEAMPTIGNLLVWRTLYLHEDEVYGDRVRVGVGSHPSYLGGWSLAQMDEPDLTLAERRLDPEGLNLARFAWFADGWVGRAPDDPTLIADLRYSLSSEAFDPIWGIRFTAGTAAGVDWVNRSRDRKISPASLWREITGRDDRYRPVPASH